jgi:hypothetical protein
MGNPEAPGWLLEIYILPEGTSEFFYLPVTNRCPGLGTYAPYDNNCSPTGTVVVSA